MNTQEKKPKKYWIYQSLSNITKFFAVIIIIEIVLYWVLK